MNEFGKTIMREEIRSIKLNENTINNDQCYVTSTYTKKKKNDFGILSQFIL